MHHQYITQVGDVKKARRVETPPVIDVKSLDIDCLEKFEDKVQTLFKHIEAKLALE